jgi:hypothetical protein
MINNYQIADFQKLLANHLQQIRTWNYVNQCPIRRWEFLPLPSQLLEFKIICGNAHTDRTIKSGEGVIYSTYEFIYKI